MNMSRCYTDSPVLIDTYAFHRNGQTLRESKKSVLFYTTDCGNEKEDLGLQAQQRSTSLTALHIGSGLQQQQPILEPRMSQLETLEAKMASIEVSLSTTPRRKKGSSISGGMTSPASHRNRDHYKELDSLRIALRDKENIIQTLKGQLCNTLSNRLALRNGAPPLKDTDKKTTEERLQRLRRDADNKKLAIKNLKLALERLDITDNIDVRIQQAELEYRLGREELELLTFREESRALQAALELAETQEKQKSDTIFSCVSGAIQVTIHALEVSADPKSPRFGAGPREEAPGLYVDWAVEDSGLCKGDRILEVNGKLVVGAGRNDLARLLAVAPDSAQIVVLRKGESLTALRTLRSDNLRLTHRIGYLEEQVRDLLTPTRTEVSVESPTSQQKNVQVFQKGPQVTALVANLPGLNMRSPTESRQSLPTVKSRQSENFKRLTESRNSKELDFSSDGATNGGHQKSRNKQKSPATQLTRSTASLVFKQSQLRRHSPRRRTRIDSAMEHLQKTRKTSHQMQSLDFDSEPTYYRLQDSQLRTLDNFEVPNVFPRESTKTRPAPPKKPLRLSLHRAASLQSVESAPPSSGGGVQEILRKPTKRNYRGDPPTIDRGSRSDINGELIQAECNLNLSAPPQPPPRTPSRAESCQSALRWPSPKPRAQLSSMTVEKWC
ncbi:uncharacterized protein LOC127278907 [Leptopilina boulardi]|uniref:uncharacterized protein LOC127278907 n=1 Tax=Leptopilina boulardi TaxID=63433 RepID=UPI0021F5DA98|nr:uncharacterized protein LOC127278907 [Leptopilina boulardi]